MTSPSANRGSEPHERSLPATGEPASAGAPGFETEPAPRPAYFPAPIHHYLAAQADVGQEAQLEPAVAPQFARALRGYDRAQVDLFVNDMRYRLASMRLRARKAETDLRRAQAQLKQAKAELRQLRFLQITAGPRASVPEENRPTRLL